MGGIVIRVRPGHDRVPARRLDPVLDAVAIRIQPGAVAAVEIRENLARLHACRLRVKEDRERNQIPRHFIHIDMRSRVIALDLARRAHGGTRRDFQAGRLGGKGEGNEEKQRCREAAHGTHSDCGRRASTL